MGKLRATEVEIHFRNDHTDQDRDAEMDLEMACDDHDYYLSLQSDDPFDNQFSDLDDPSYWDDFFPNLWANESML